MQKIWAIDATAPPVQFAVRYARTHSSVVGEANPHNKARDKG